MGGFVQTPRQFLNVSSGKLMNKKDNVYLDGYIGRLKSIEFKIDTYNDEENQKWKIVMVDTESATSTEACISFKADAYFATGFFARIGKISLAQPFLLGVYHPKGKSEKLSLCYMKQNGATVEAEKDLVPMPVSVKVGAKEVLNWEEPLKKCHEIADKLKMALATLGDLKPVPSGEGGPVIKDGDLPF